MLISRRSSRGFTLIELMIVLMIVGIAASIALPSFRELTINYRVRSASESMLNGLNLARSEALRRNEPVTFTLNATGPGWSVTTGNGSSVIQSKGDGEGGLTIVTTGSAMTVQFMPSGMIRTGVDRLESVNLTASGVASVDERRIAILGGGLIRMCMPKVAAEKDPRGC